MQGEPQFSAVDIQHPVAAVIALDPSWVEMDHRGIPCSSGDLRRIAQRNIDFGIIGFDVDSLGASTAILQTSA